MKLTEFRKLTNNRDPKFDKALNELGDSLKEFVKRRRLFVCSGGLDRSPTAAELFNDSDKYEAKFCGIHPIIASIPLTKQALEWADEIFCMEPEHKRFILEMFPLIIVKKSEIIILGIGNEYTRNDAELKKQLRIKLKNWLK